VVVSLALDFPRVDVRSKLMQCQKCSKPATFHITDIVEKGKFCEYHLCEEHARAHLGPSEDTREEPPISELAKKLIVNPAIAREPSAADKQVCPVCQITYLEFHKSGRLGCPYDYEVFRDELMPLLESIHGDTRHSGKVPKRAPRNTQQQTTLIQLRNELKRAVAAEDYESAAGIRDKIKLIEQDQGR
jgi:protein arginine kinase activator